MWAQVRGTDVLRRSLGKGRWPGVILRMALLSRCDLHPGGLRQEIAE